MNLFKLPPRKVQMMQYAGSPSGVVNVRVKSDRPVRVYALNREMRDAYTRAISGESAEPIDHLGFGEGTDAAFSAPVPQEWYLTVENLDPEQETSVSCFVTALVMSASPSGASGPPAWGASGIAWGDPRLRWGGKG